MKYFFAGSALATIIMALFHKSDTSAMLNTGGIILFGISSILHKLEKLKQ